MHLEANFEPHKLSFDDLSQLDQQWESTSVIPLQLKSLEGHSIEIWGFLYQQANEQWILAAMPNLKSCCLDNNKITGIRLNVNWLSIPQPSSLAVLVKGKLDIDRQELSRRLYRLENAEILPQVNISWLYAILLALLLAIGIGLFFKKTRYWG